MLPQIKTASKIDAVNMPSVISDYFNNQKYRRLANDWISNHKKPEPLDFRSTLSGIEKQFK